MDIVERLRKLADGERPYGSLLDVMDEAADEIERLQESLKGEREANAVLTDEIERLRGALRTIDDLIPKTKEITDFPFWAAIAGDIAEGALNGTWPAYGVMPAPAKETK